MAKIKWLYEFEVYKETVSQQKNKSKNDKGETVTTEKEVVTRKPFKFGIRQPNRKLYDDADLFYSVKLSEGIKAGLLTKPLLEKRYENDGGIFNELDRDRYVDLYREIFEKENALQKAAVNLENETEKKKTRAMAEIYADLTLLRKELQEYEVRYSSLFDQTAENRAKNQSIMWWVLNLAQHTKDGEEESTQMFGGGDYETKLDVYDAFEEEGDLFWDEAVKKMIYFVSFWHSGQANTEDDFKNAENFYNESYGTYGAEEEEEVVPDDPEETIEEVKRDAKTSVKKKRKPRKKTTAKKKEPKVEELKAEELDEKEEQLEMVAEDSSE
jgi:hypothetical protein